MKKKKKNSGKSSNIIVLVWVIVVLILVNMSFFSSSPEDLSEMLAAGTKEVHEKAENTQFVKDFLRGRIRKELFKVSLK